MHLQTTGSSSALRCRSLTAGLMIEKNDLVEPDVTTDPIVASQSREWIGGKGGEEGLAGEVRV